MEKNYKNIDSMITYLKKVKKHAEELWAELEGLDDEFMDPYGIRSDEIDALEDQGIDWEDVYEPLQDMEIHNIPQEIDELIDHFETEKEELFFKEESDKFYKWLFMYKYNQKKENGITPVVIPESEFEEMYDIIYGIMEITSKEDFLKHMAKLSWKETK